MHKQDVELIFWPLGWMLASIVPANKFSRSLTNFLNALIGLWFFSPWLLIILSLVFGKPFFIFIIMGLWISLGAFCLILEVHRHPSNKRYRFMEDGIRR